MTAAGRRLSPSGEIESALAAAIECESLGELGERVLPALQRAVGACATLLYRYDDEGRLEALSGALAEPIDHYARHYVKLDPVQEYPKRLLPRPRVVLATRHVDPRAFRRSPAYGEFYSAFELEHLACVWLTSLPYASPGMTGVLFARPPGSLDFDERDQALLAGALPILSGAAARAERLRDLDLKTAALETLAAATGPARLLLTAGGRLLWASPSCERLLGSSPPPALIGAARRLYDVALGRATAPSIATMQLQGRFSRVVANLSVLRTPSGAPLVLVELESDAALALDGSELARRFQLTRAEGTVLALLAEGLSNSTIAARLHVSVETVRTHVRRTLAKLGLHSRVQAALLVTRAR
jgi:DNA-binding CsgD family transcriptional regulator